MKKMRWIGVTAGSIVVLAGIIWACFGEKIKTLHVSLNSFKDENLAHTFQHTPEIQPTKKISRGENTFQFLQEDNAALTEKFVFENTRYPVGAFLEDPLGKYIPEFKNTKLEDIPIKACLQMASGIDFNEDTDMSGFSMRTLMGSPAMKVIAKYGMQEEPYTYRRYLSINTEILGKVITNATGYSLAEYMEEKLWKKIGAAHDAYWTLSNGTELAMGGLSVSLRDYARFARLYLNGGIYNGEQILSESWVRDSMDVSAEYSKPGANHDAYNAIGYGYQWWVPEGEEGEFMAIGVYGQWIYVNPVKQIIIVKTSADPNFMENGYELKYVEFFRAVADGIV